jgi:hypothetical protein
MRLNRTPNRNFPFGNSNRSFLRNEDDHVSALRDELRQLCTGRATTLNFSCTLTVTVRKQALDESRFKAQNNIFVRKKVVVSSLLACGFRASIREVASSSDDNFRSRKVPLSDFPCRQKS